MLKIRSATKDDVGIILKFIKELAEFEKLSKEVKATEESLLATLFENTPRAEVLIGEINGIASGFALFFHNYSTFLAKPGLYLEDLYVCESSRGSGLGKMFLSELARIAESRNCGRMEWAVLDWNKAAIRFYETLGAVQMADWTTHRLDESKIHLLANSQG